MLTFNVISFNDPKQLMTRNTFQCATNASKFCQLSALILSAFPKHRRRKLLITISSCTKCPADRRSCAHHVKLSISFWKHLARNCVSRSLGGPVALNTFFTAQACTGGLTSSNANSYAAGGGRRSLVERKNRLKIAHDCIALESHIF